MKLILTLCLAGLLLLPAQAERRVGEAQVRADANGQPCFTISEQEEKRSGAPDFQSVTVSEGARVSWHMSMPRDRTFSVNSSMCIPYGGRVTALPQTPAAVLVEGKVYTVQVEARPGGNMATPLRYQGRFCLAARRGASPRLHFIDADAQPGRDLYGCQPRR